MRLKVQQYSFNSMRTYMLGDKVREGNRQVKRTGCLINWFAPTDASLFSSPIVAEAAF